MALRDSQVQRRLAAVQLAPLRIDQDRGPWLAIQKTALVRVGAFLIVRRRRCELRRRHRSLRARCGLQLGNRRQAARTAGRDSLKEHVEGQLWH